LNQSVGNADLIVITDLRVKRKQNAMILRELGLTQIVSRSLIGIARLTVGAHDPTSGRDSFVKKALHNRFLVKTVG